jgi:FAD/FMN-containing dehydrogenase
VITRGRLRLLPAYRLHEMRWDWPAPRALTALPRMISDNHHFEFFWNPRTDACAMKALNPTDREPGEPAPGQRIDWSDRIFPSERTFRFNEMEFSVPAERGPRCLAEIRALMRERHHDVAWPIEYRTVQPDDIPLSPASERDTVTISVHQAAELDHRPFFRDVEAIFRTHQGRPHWGKMHTHVAAELRALYPQWERFQAVRRRLDPAGRFLNDHLRAVLGA